MLIIIDLTAFSNFEQERLKYLTMKKSNSCVSQEMVGPLETILSLLKLLLKEATVLQIPMIKAVQDGARFI